MSINPTSGTIFKGASTTTTITTNGDGTMSCSSSDTGVATCSVSGNTVTINGVAAGSAKITVNQAAGTIYAAASRIYSVTVIVPQYYAFGNPTTSSTTNYASLGKNVFATLYSDNKSKGICIIRNNTLHCFKINNWAEEQNHVQQVFSDISCTVDSSRVDCNASDFDCYVTSDGTVRCSDHSDNSFCNMYSHGVGTCT